MFDLQQLVRPNILQLKPYSSARDEFAGADGIFLDANENPYGILNRYPDPYQRQLRSKLSKRNGIDAQDIFIGNGSDEVIDLTFRIFCNPGIDKALTFSPTYGMYNVSAEINNVELVKVPLTASFQMNLEALKPCFDDERAKLFFICSPNNPTGNLIDRKDIEFVLNNFNGIVIIDEAYIDFADAPSLVHWVNQYPNLIVSQTFSKAWGLAAARVGIAYASAEIVELYNKVKPPYNVSGLNQEAALDALDNPDEFEANLASILTEKERLRNELETIDWVRKIYPSQANFWLVEVDDASKRYQELVDKSIIVRNRTTHVNNCLRITVGTPSENNELLTTLKSLT